MASNGKLKVGVIGAGFMGKTYATVVARNLRDTATLAAVSAEQGGDELAAEHGTKFFADWREMIAGDAVDIVLIATPQAAHHDMAVEAAKAGKHVMIEKPMARTVAECDEIIAACKQAGVKLSVAQTQRHRMCNFTAQEMIASGKLGKVLQIRSTNMNPETKSTVPRWNLAPEHGSLVLGHCIHNFDAARFFTGQEIKTIFARPRNLMPALPSDGTVDAFLLMADGSVVQVFSSFEIAKPGFPNTQFQHQIICEEGLLDVDAYGELKLAMRGGQWETIAVQPPIDWAGKGFLDDIRLESYTRHIRTFLETIGTGNEPPISGWDGRQAVAAVKACEESTKTGKAIELM